MSELHAGGLRMWRRFLLVRERDAETGLYRCQVSGMLCQSWEVQAHHTNPKAIHPEQAYLMSNAALVRTDLHQGAVHAGSASKDLSSLHHWKEWVPMFYRQNRLARRRDFNAAAQPRLDAYLKGRGVVV